ncbi:MAG: hypothetical protein K8S21_02550 [Gemmatimonadetes bacterium]|nr:hypothetical protein [Gemmatimonadota bacterium]
MNDWGATPSGTAGTRRPRRRGRIAGWALLIVAVVVGVFSLLPASHPSAAAVEREITRLTHERDSLRTLVRATADSSDLFARRPAGDVLIALPAPFVVSLVKDIVAGWFTDVEVTIHGLRFHKVGDVRASLGVLGRRRVGSYDMNITFDEILGRMTAGAPSVQLGGDDVRVAVPVRVNGGTVKATIAIDWDSKGLANAVCGDLAATHAVTGTVRVSEHIAIGHLALSAREGAVLVDPEFPDLAIRLFPEADTASVAVLDSLLATKGGLCGIAVQKVRVSDLIVARVARGFLIRIPQKFFRPVRLPIAVEREWPTGGRELTLMVSPRDLVVTRAAVWLAADVRIAPPR